jgi:predicted RNA-binding protein with EMAP domain
MQSSNKSNQDLVQVQAGTICYDVHNERVESGTVDFAVLELDQSAAAVQHTTSVQLTAGTSKKDAVESLQSIIEVIDRQGLPQTTLTVPREDAALIMKIQEDTDKLSESVNELPPHLRDWMQAVLEHAGEPGFSEYLKKLCEKLGIPEDEAEGDGNDA